MSQILPEADNIIPFAMPVRTTPPRRPDDLDMSRMQARHGRVLGALSVWFNRAKARRELRSLALREPDSVLADSGMTRAAAAREARRWFWQDFRC